MTTRLGDADVEALLDAFEVASSRVDLPGLSRRADRDAEFPWPVWQVLTDLGLPALQVPDETGRAPAGAAAVCRIVERLARHGIAASTALFTFNGFGAHLVGALPASHPLRRLLPGLGEGSVRSALSLTEAGGGSDLSGMTTTLSRTDTGWTLHGAKMFTTLAGESTHLVVGGLVRDAEGRWTDRLGLAVVAPDAPGVTMNRVSTQALRSCPTYEVFYDDVAVPAGDVIEPPSAIAVLKGVLNHERLAVAAQSCGLGAVALTDARDHAAGRPFRAGALADLQVVRHRVVDRWQDLQAARALVGQAAAQVDAGGSDGVLPTMAQRFAARAAFDAADLAVQLHGGAGLTTEVDAQRWWRDTRLHLIGPVAQEMSADYLAGAAFGRDRL